MRKTIGTVVAGVALLAATAGVARVGVAASPYRDIAGLSTLARTAITTLYQDGVMNGTAPGKFSPNGLVTRAQAVKFVVNVLGVKLIYSRTPNYSDVGPGSQYYPYIETAVNDGILNGMTGTSGSFEPSTPITRVDLAVLAVNALGAQNLASSMVSDTTTYSQLTDLSSVPAGDLGYANAGMKLGVVPPLTAHRYDPNSKVDREQLAVALYRVLMGLQASRPVSVSVTQSASSVGVGDADALSAAVRSVSGKQLSSNQLAGYTITYTVTGANASDATVSTTGIFVASDPGVYSVEVTVSGGALTQPITGLTSVGVWGAPVALKLVPASPALPADGTGTDSVTVEVVDANGTVVGNYSATVDVTDTEALLGAANTAGDQPSDFTYTSATTGTVALADGTGTFAVGATSSVGLTDTITATAPATALAEATAIVTTVAPSATGLTLLIASGYPVALSANTQTSTEVAVELVDSAGNPYTSGTGQYVTLTLAGPGSFAAGSVVTTYTAFDSGTYDVPVYSEAGESGSIVVSATSTGGLSAKQLIIATNVNTSAASLAVTATTGTDTAGNTYTGYTVTVDDTKGHPITTATGTIVVSDNAALAGGVLGYSLSDTVGSFIGSTPFTVTIGASGVATFYVETRTAGTGAVTLTLTGTTGQAAGLVTTAQFAYTAGPPATVKLSPSAVPYKVLGGSTVTVTAQLEDAAGEPTAKANEDVTFAIPANSAGVTLPNGQADETLATNANGLASALLVVPNTAGSFTVEASYGSTISGSGQSDETITTIATTYTVDYATRVVVTPSALIAEAGAAITGYTVTAANGTGTEVPTPDEISLTSSNTNVVSVPAGDATFVGTTPPLTLYAGQAGSTVLTFTDVSNPSMPSTQVAVTVSAGTVGVQELVEYNGEPIGPTNPVSIYAGSPVELTVVNADAAGDPVPVTGTSPLTVDLDVGAGVSGGYLTAPGGSPTSTVQVPLGQTSAIVYFESSEAETLDTSGDLTAVAVP